MVRCMWMRSQNCCTHVIFDAVPFLAKSMKRYGEELELWPVVANHPQSRCHRKVRKKSSMENTDCNESIERGIKHVGDRRADQAIDYLNAGIGSRAGCLDSVVVHADAQCLMSWFKRKDLQSHKHWAYVAAKIRRMSIQLKPWAWFPAYEHLYALLSDNDELVRWYSQHRVPFFVEDEERGNEAVNKDDPSLVTFHSYQALLALNGDWESLHRRCEQILSLPETPERKDFLVDHRFCLALADGDKKSMEAALNNLAGPEMAPRRNFGFAFGLTQNLIATHATIYAKIAWRHGYEVEVASPWVPREWLPIAPLSTYEDPWPFMKDFDIWQRFEAGWDGWSPEKN